jgi:2,3-bisphosphoglycerate-independent phosphoglycerate mutase
MNPQTALIILAGWGIGRKDRGNPLHVAGLRALPALATRYPYGALQASGIAAGLPWNEPGTGETGHMTIGAGRTVWQALSRINRAIETGAFNKNEMLIAGIRAAGRSRGAVHCAGLLSDRSVHAAQAHLEALIALAEREGARQVYAHLWSDGADGAPRAFGALAAALAEKRGVRIASVAGRYYAMDGARDAERTEAAARALAGSAPHGTLESAMQELAAGGLSDAFLKPTTIDPEGGVKPGDTLIYFNFKTPALPMIEGARVISFEEAFPQERISRTLGDILAENGVFQMRIAETARYEHITRFINCGRTTPYEREYRVLVPARADARPETHPAMMTAEIADRAAQAIEEGIGCVMANIACPDVVAHTGDFQAAVAAARAADEAIGRIARAAESKNATLVITADHGNIEEMLDQKTGVPETKHNLNPVPVIVARPGMERQKTPQEIAARETTPQGTLADIAPTILAALGIQKPPEMTGVDLAWNL